MADFVASEAELLKRSVLKEGHLLKIGRKLKLPKLHYYVLKPCGVYCFGTQDHDIPHSYIPLEPVEEISLSLGTVVEARTRLHCIKITDKRKQNILACHSMEIRNSWITAILTAVAQNIVHENESEQRKRFDSSSNSDEVDGAVFCDAHFTSPFWSDKSQARRRKRLSMADLGLISKPSWLTKGTKKKSLRSKSLSFEDLHSMYPVAEVPLARKRSLHDITRHLFNSAMNRNDVDGHKSRDSASSKAARGGKKRWSLFSSVSSLSVNQGSFDIRDRKITSTDTTSSNGRNLAFDTKL